MFMPILLKLTTCFERVTHTDPVWTVCCITAQSSDSVSPLQKVSQWTFSKDVINLIIQDGRWLLVLVSLFHLVVFAQHVLCCATRSSFTREELTNIRWTTSVDFWFCSVFQRDEAVDRYVSGLNMRPLAQRAKLWLWIRSSSSSALSVAGCCLCKVSLDLQLLHDFISSESQFNPQQRLGKYWTSPTDLDEAPTVQSVLLNHSEF